MATDTTKKPGEITDEAVASRSLIPTEQKTLDLIGQVLGGLGTPTLHSFKGTPQEQWRQIALCEGGDIKSKADWGDRPIAMEHYYLHRVTVNGKSPGELVDAVRCVLVQPDGTRIGFVSDGIAKSIARIIMMFGVGPYKPAINIKIVDVKTPNGHTYNIIPA